MDAAQTRHHTLTPARVLIGSLVAGAGLTVLGFFFGGTSASAAEPAPVSPIGSVVSSATQGLGDTVSSVTAAVAPVLPAPAQQTVSAVATPVVQTVDRVVAQAPVASVVAPVASTVDAVVAAVPVANAVLPAAPVSTVTQPVTTAADTAVSQVATVVDAAVAPLTTAAAGHTPAPLLDTPQIAASILGAAGAPTVAAALSLSASRSALLGSRASAAFVPFTGSAPLPAAPLSPEPFGPGGGGLPAGGSAGSSGGSGAPGGAVPGAAAAADGFFLPNSVWSGLSGVPADDLVPAGPVADHDISPD
jgi:hypothetical protein